MVSSDLSWQIAADPSLTHTPELHLAQTYTALEFLKRITDVLYVSDVSVVAAIAVAAQFCAKPSSQAADPAQQPCGDYDIEVSLIDMRGIAQEV